MARADNSYSRLVGALKVILPLAALVLLSTLFLLSRGRDPGDVLPYADLDLEALLLEPRMTAPTYTGVTRDGAAIRLSADAALPGATPETGARAERPRLLLVAPDGSQTTAVAEEARIDPAGRSLVMTGDVTVTTTGGYSIDTEVIVAALDRSRIETRAAVFAQGPQGSVRSDNMVISRTEAGAAEVVVFKGGVKLLYQPPE